MSTTSHTNLPVHHVLPSLLDALKREGRAVLEAPPGAGKTTMVPLALLEENLSGRIVMLEPRRLAVRGAAWRIAELIGEKPGGRVGYRMRGETKVGPDTQIEIITEGILTSMMRRDPELSGIEVLIFDEFHERSVHTDVGLALALHAAELFRPDLKIVVMSATLNGPAVAALLGGAPIIRSEGEIFPVETIYAGRDRDRWVEEDVAGLVRRIRPDTSGDILLFLPGVGEIERTMGYLDDLRSVIDIYPLHGRLGRVEQSRAIAPSPPGRRKIVLATSIAETSLTIEGVEVVVDAGLQRRPRFDPSTGLSRLETSRVSRASADQRRGRAGRLRPGICYRLWDRAEDHTLRPEDTPEILETDLLPLALDLLAWGASPEELRWLDPPPPGPYAAALELGERLGLIDATGGLTVAAEEVLRLPVHPRLGMMIRAARQYRGGVELGASLAAILEEGDPLRLGRGEEDPDIRRRLDLLRSAERGERLPAKGDRYRVERILREVRRITDHARSLPARREEEKKRLPSAALLLAVAYPDRIAARRGEGSPRYLMSNGRPVRLPEGAPSPHPFLVVPAAGGMGEEGRIELAAPISIEEIESVLGERIVEENVVGWDRDRNRATATAERRLDSLTLSSRRISRPDDQMILRAVVQEVLRAGLSILPWSRDATTLRNRITFLYLIQERGELPLSLNWPDLSDDALLGRVEEWLTPLLMQSRGKPGRLDQINLVKGIQSLLGWEEIASLDTLAPERITVPSGSQIRIDYSRPEEPVLPVRLQEMFGSTSTPRIAQGTWPLTLHLLSPAHRPLQVTRDLEGFWERTYDEVRKEMKGRYPKHYWPEDPKEAEPRRGVRRRRL